MILTGNAIQEKKDKDIIIEPFDPSQLNPNSYNLRLHDELIIYTESELDMKKPNPTDKIHIAKEGFLLEPRRLYLGRTVEYTETHNLVPMLEGRSSIGRLGMSVNITAGFGDLGFCGYWTLEIYVLHPMRIYPYVQICQIFYHTIEGKAVAYQSSKYQNNRGIQPSLLFQEL